MMKIENKNNPYVTVITSAYNAEKTLKESIESIMAQSYGHFEYIVINHGSNDNTKNIIKEYEKQDERVRLLDLPENLGCPAAAINIAMREAKGEYLSILDADDSYMPDFLEVMIKTVLEYDADVAACSCDRTFTGKPWHCFKDNINKFEREWKFLSVEDYKRDFDNFFDELDSFMLLDVWWNKLYRLEFLRKNRLMFPENILYFADAFFHVEMYRRLPKILFSPFLGIKWNQNEGSTSYILSDKRNEETLMYAKKFYEYGNFLKEKCICNDLTKFKIIVMRAFIGLPMFRRLTDYDKYAFLALCRHYTSNLADDLADWIDYTGCVMGNRALCDALSFYMGKNVGNSENNDYDWLYGLKNAMETTSFKPNTEECLDIVFHPKNHFSGGVEFLLDNILEGE